MGGNIGVWFVGSLGASFGWKRGKGKGWFVTVRLFRSLYDRKCMSHSTFYRSVKPPYGEFVESRAI